METVDKIITKLENFIDIANEHSKIQKFYDIANSDEFSAFISDTRDILDEDENGTELKNKLNLGIKTITLEYGKNLKKFKNDSKEFFFSHTPSLFAQLKEQVDKKNILKFYKTFLDYMSDHNSTILHYGRNSARLFLENIIDLLGSKKLLNFTDEQRQRLYAQIQVDSTQTYIVSPEHLA